MIMETACYFGSPSVKILVIEDYIPLRSTVVKGLCEEGYAVDETGDGKEGLWLTETREYDVVLLDLMLPGLDGMTILRRLRDSSNDVHVLITSARDSVQHRVEGLDLGADDYLVKPFSMDELFARIRSIVRRKYEKVSPVQSYGDLKIDTNKKEVWRSDNKIELSAREYSILEYLIARQGHVVTRDSIWEHVYDFNADLNSNVIDVYIGFLRKKMEVGGLSRLIHTRRNQGYVFEAGNS